MVSTQDGLSLSLGAGGAVESLKVEGVEYASAALPSGFTYRELPATATDIAPNGSFEDGSGKPISWGWSDDNAGFWSWDDRLAIAGSRSLRLDVPGSTPRRSPTLTSVAFPIRAGTPYTFSCQFRTEGLSSHLDLYVVERYADGSGVQRGVVSSSGTTDWQGRALTFTSSPSAVSASFRVDISNGYGTAWIDDVRMLDLFAGRSAIAFPGAVAQDSKQLVFTGSDGGLDLSARFTDVDTALRVDVTLTDSSGRDRAIELSFGLPLAVPGWIWDDDFVTPMTIASRVRYENLDKGFGDQTLGHTHSTYPFAAVQGPGAALSLAVPMGPSMYRLAYDDAGGFRATYDLGLSPATARHPSTAEVSFWIYRQDPQWGLRSTAEKYYALNAAAFTTFAREQGAWVLGNRQPIQSVPDPQDFGWAYHEQDNELAFDNASGIVALHYVSPTAWTRKFPDHVGQPQPSYSILALAIENDLKDPVRLSEDGVPVSRMAASIMETAPYDQKGLYPLFYNSYYWRSGGGWQKYPMLPDPEMPESLYGIVKEYSVDNRISAAERAGRSLGGIFLDNISANFANIENYRKSLWAYLDSPLSFSYATGSVTAYGGDSIAKFCTRLRADLNVRGLVLMGSLNTYAWFTSGLDIVGSESQGAGDLQRAYVQRALSYGKPWTNLFVPVGGAAPKEEEVLAYLRQALLLGYFPGFNGVYWDSPSSYERDRHLFRLYIPLIRTVTAAGWRPINGVTVSDPAVLVERFDDGRGDVFYLTAQNTGGVAAKPQLTLDGQTLGLEDGKVTVEELVRGRALAASRAGADAGFADTLAPGETVLYRVTAPRPSGPDRAPTRHIAPRG